MTDTKDDLVDTKANLERVLSRPGEPSVEERLALAETRVRELEAGLRETVIALDDWVVSYAPDMCTKTSVARTRTRISDHGGTLAYIAGLTARARALIKDTERG